MSDGESQNNKQLVRLVVAGSVDDGKSTLIGRLLYDCRAIYEDQLFSIVETCDRRNQEVDLSLLTDGLAAEREQGITIDVAYRYFSSSNRRFIIADVPGHEQYTRNMVTGASTANVGLIIIDARKGLLIQSKRHLFLASLLGINHIVVAVNKIDLVDYQQDVFEKIKNEFSLFASKLEIKDLQFIPISALNGDMVVNRGNNLNWYSGRTLFDYLDNIEITSDRNLIDFRLPVQLVLRPNQDFRGYAGQIESGVIRRGEKVIILPSQIRTRVKSILLGNKEVDYVHAPQSVALTFDNQVDVSRGDMIVRKDNFTSVSKLIEANICWFSQSPMRVGDRYIIKNNNKETTCLIKDIKYSINVENLHREKSSSLKVNDVGRVVLNIRDYLCYDYYIVNRNVGSFILIDEMNKETVSGGLIIQKRSSVIQPVAADLIRSGVVLWFTGLSGCGKTTIADRLFDYLVKQNISAERLDGDVLRESLTRDLGFSKDDRDRNIEQAALISKLLSKHGVVVLATFISPYKSHRQLVRDQVENFVEIFVNAPLEVCEKRDIKGLYKKARAGEIPLFTGISDGYESPDRPDIELRTAEEPVEECVDKVIKYLVSHNYLE